MTCKNLKQKLNRTLYCKHKKSDIKISECSNCKYKFIERKNVNSRSMKNRSSKLAKLERNRKSILTDDLEHCFICGSKKEHIHEIFFGKNRLNSIKYDCVIPLCSACHSRIHNDIELDLFCKKKGQLAFEVSYPELDFASVFKRSYL